MTKAEHSLCRKADTYFSAFQADRQRGRTSPAKPVTSTTPTGCSGCEKRKAWLNERSGPLKLGDKVEAITKATGIKAVVEHFSGDE
ncbi:MAG: hypothetical protein WBC44_11645 [Planctomycetaceae bacterium]